MNFFNKRVRWAEKYEEWLKENPEVKDCALSVITFLEINGLLKDLGEEKSLDRENDMLLDNQDK